MKKIKLILGLLLLAVICNAQSIKGHLVDKRTDENVPFANVALFDISNDNIVSGTTTDFDGKFELSPPSGNYKMVVTVIGYSDYTLEKTSVVKDIDLGKLRLVQSDLILDEVQVTAEKSYIQNKPGKQILTVGKDISSRGGNITAVMKALPSVEVSPKGDISIRGNSNIKILINGKQPPYGIDAKTLLKQFPTSSIDRIEVITNTTAKDDPESAGGAINVITKKNEMQGLNIAINGEAGFKPFRSNAGVTLNYSKKRLNSYMTYAYYQEKYIFDNRDENRYNTPLSKIKSLINIGDGDYEDKGHLVIGGLDYKIDSSSSLNMELMYNNYKNNWGYNSNNNYKIVNGSSNNTTSKNKSSEKINFTDIAVNYKFENKKEYKLDIKTHITIGSTASKRDLSKSMGGIVTDKSRIDEKGIFKTAELSADYSQPIGENGTFEAGIFNDAIAFDANQDATIGNIEETDYTFKQHRHAVYGIYEHKFGKLSSSLGIRGEYYSSRTKEKTKDASNQNYTSFFPNLKLQYDLSSSGAHQNINFSYARTLRRPNYEELDPNIDYSNPFQLEKGNADLKPEFIDKVELNHTYRYNKIRISTTMFASQTNDVIQAFSTLQNDGVIMNSYTNYSQKRSAGIEFNNTFKPFKWWHISPAGIFMYSRFAAPKDKTTPYNKTGNSWKASLNNTFKINKQHTFQIQAFYNGKNINAYFTRNSYAQINFGYEYSMFDGIATITASVTDILNGGGKEDYNIIGKGFNSQTVWNSNNRFFKLGFSMFIR